MELINTALFTGIGAAILYGILKFLQPHFAVKKELEEFKHITEEVTVQMQVIMNHIGMCVYICKPTGECIYASKQLCELFGRPEEDMRGFGWVLAIPDKDRNRAYQKWIDCVKNKKPYEDTYPVNTGTELIEVYTSAIVCFDFNNETEEFTKEILFYIGTAKKMHTVKPS